MKVLIAARSKELAIYSSKKPVVVKPKKHIPDPSEAPLCKCGCGEKVGWSKLNKQWNIYIIRHQSRSLNYKPKREFPLLCGCGCGKFVKWCYGKYLRGHSSKGRVQTAETREKCRLAILGKKRSEYTISKKIGKKHTEETKEKCRKAALERWSKPEFQAKMVEKLSQCKYTKRGYREDLGFYVRSSWEANYSRLLKFLGTEYKYEPKRFIVKDSNNKIIFSYLPDFYLPEFKKYIEVKGYWYKSSREKFDKLLEYFPDLKIDLLVEQDYKKLIKKFSHLVPDWEFNKKR
jgi:hypothetical protein